MDKQIVNINIISSVNRGVSGTKHVIVTLSDGSTIDGFLKSSKREFMDDVEVAVSQIGNLLGVDVANVFKINFNGKPSIISQNVINNPESEELVLINDIIDKDDPSIQELIKKGQNIPKGTLRDKDNIKFCIDSGLKAVESKFKTPEEQMDYRKKYFDMLMFDLMTNQVDRSFENFGIIRNKETSAIKFAPLFDNGCVHKPDLDENACELNFKQCDRKELIKILFSDYYDDIKDMAEKIEDIYQNKDNNYDKIEDIIKTNIKEIWIQQKINENINTIGKLQIEKKRNINNDMVNILDNLVEKDPFKEMSLKTTNISQIEPVI